MKHFVVFLILIVASGTGTAFATNNTNYHLMPFGLSELLEFPPLKQLKLGILVNEIQCKQNLVLIQKYDGSPACVNKESVSKLMEHQWANKHDQAHINKKETNNLAEKETINKPTLLVENITTLKPNSMEWFYYPESPVHEKSDTPIPRNTDTYRLFMLIRLPEWMGGNANDASAYRAYSARSLEDTCIVKYWPNDRRQTIESPCWGEQYRAIDGAMTFGNTFRSAPLMALPQLDLSVDGNGFMYVDPPKWSKTENGIIGYGKEITIDDFRAGSKFLIDSFAKTHPDYPAIPIEFAGYDLADISVGQHRVDVSYFNFPDNSDRISSSISKSPVGTGYTNAIKSNSETWHIGDTTVTISGNALDRDSSAPELFKSYEIRFKGDGFYYAINGKDLEFIKKEIVKNYFPEYEYDDMVLVSKYTE